MQIFNETVKGWMTEPVISISPDATVIEADRMMREYGIRRLPVIKKDKLVGIVTRGDVREARASAATSLSIWELNYLIARLTVAKVMSSDVITIEPDANIADAADLMLNKKVSGIPVLNDKKNVVGIITESDIFRMVVKNYQKSSETA